jgi:hypothetical protein
MIRKTEISDAAANAEPGPEAPVPARRAVLKAAASAPVILTLMGRSAHAEYNGGEYLDYADCEVAPPDPPRNNPNACPHPPNN